MWDSGKGSGHEGRQRRGFLRRFCNFVCSGAAMVTRRQRECPVISAN